MLSTIIKDGRFWIIVLNILIRILVTPIGPLVTSDLKRNIFYGAAFWKLGFKVYDLKPLEIDPSFSITDPLSGKLSWDNNTYDYPWLHLLFFAFVSLVPFPIIATKTVFTFIDIVNFLLLYMLEKNRLSSPLYTLTPTLKKNTPSHMTSASTSRVAYISWLYLFVSIIFSNIEGQVISIEVLTFLVAYYLYRHEKTRLASYLWIALSFHWKYLTIILFPTFLIIDATRIWLQHKDIQQIFQEMLKPIVLTIAVLIGMSIPPFLQSRYILNSQFFIGFQYDVKPWSPFYIGTLMPAAFFMLAYWLYTIYVWIKPLFSTHIQYNTFWKTIIEESDHEVIALILVQIFFLFIYRFAMPWAWLYFFPVIASLEPKKRRTLFFIYAITAFIGAINFIQLTVTFAGFIDILQHGI